MRQRVSAILTLGGIKLRASSQNVRMLLEKILVIYLKIEHSAFRKGVNKKSIGILHRLVD